MVFLPDKRLQEINVQNMNVELVAQMFKNYQSNVLFHLEGKPAALLVARETRKLMSQFCKRPTI